MADYTDKVFKTKAEVVQELYNDGKLSSDEVEKLNDTNIIEISGISIDFSKLDIEPETKLISKDESYVGYYADVNNDGDVDGIIFADLAVGMSTD